MKFIRIKNPKANSVSFRFINLEDIDRFLCEYNPLNEKLIVEIKLKSNETIYFQINGSQQDCKNINRNFDLFKSSLDNYFDLAFL